MSIEPGGGLTVQGQPSPQGLETPQRGGGSGLGEIRPSEIRSLSVCRERGPGRSDGVGCLGTRVALCHPVRFSPIRADHSYPRQRV